MMEILPSRVSKTTPQSHRPVSPGEVTALYSRLITKSMEGSNASQETFSKALVWSKDPREQMITLFFLFLRSRANSFRGLFASCPMGSM
jgi:hypothetical protein